MVAFTVNDEVAFECGAADGQRRLFARCGESLRRLHLRHGNRPQSYIQYRVARLCLRPNDFRVQPSSAAVNAGVTISGVMDDFNGLLRPRGSAYDIGAYEQ